MELISLIKISALTGDQVTVGSGTLYNLLEQFLEAGMIREVKVEGRRRSYILTDKGREMLIMKRKSSVNESQTMIRSLERGMTNERQETKI